MKNKIMFILLSTFSLFACKKDIAPATGNTGTITVTPESVVPAAVISSFNVSFSTATEREWQHNSDDSFTCQFNMDHQRHEARFDDNGHQSSHSVICMDAAIPEIILDAFRQGFPSDNVYEWNLTNENTWKAHFMRASVKWEVTFSNDGTILKSEHE
ncbi:MAG: hypothetical protein ABI921_14600 [Panacibacter sp.]